jgi:hypothetical protein
MYGILSEGLKRRECVGKRGYCLGYALVPGLFGLWESNSVLTLVSVKVS